MQRTTTSELLDDDLGTPEEIRASLDDLWRINRRLGGVSGCLRLLERVLTKTGARTARVLDVGCGDSRLAAYLQRELPRRGYPAEFFVLDRRFSHLSRGRPVDAGLRPLVGDVFALPFAGQTFDVVMCNLFFHHFSGEKARELLQSLARIASRAVLINDLERHILPYLFIRIGIPFSRSRLTRHDGPASVRQAYTRDELADLAAAAGFQKFEAVRMLPFRLGLTLWK